jgi:hypothetical protein
MFERFDWDGLVEECRLSAIACAKSAGSGVTGETAAFYASAAERLVNIIEAIEARTSRRMK